MGVHAEIKIDEVVLDKVTEVQPRTDFKFNTDIVH
jgi:hypothetical protein